MDANHPSIASCRFSQCEVGQDAYKQWAYPLDLRVPADWRDKLTLVDLPIGAAKEAECQDLLQLQKQRVKDPALERDIRAQAGTHNDAVAPVWKAAKVDPMLPHNKARVDLQQAVIDCMRAPIVLLKIDVDRGRPGCCCKAGPGKLLLDPMFVHGEKHHPCHPSYPSGHAALAYAMALVLREIQSSCWPAVETAANLVGKNREMAGVHFATDSEAGRQLAQHLVPLLMLNASFKALVCKAAINWPN